MLILFLCPDKVKAVFASYQVQVFLCFISLNFSAMGTIKQGILGGFSGKVGSVIGGSWKGISYMRSQAQSVKNPQTTGQVNQRTKFAIALAFLKPITEAIRVGFKLYAQKQTAFNAAMSYTLANAISGTSSDDYALDYANALWIMRMRLSLAVL